LNGELSILRVLDDWIDPTIADCNSLKVHTKISLSNFYSKMISNSRDIVPGIAFTCDEEITALELGICLKESINEQLHVCCNFLLS
jgi:hypothetical protein